MLLLTTPSFVRFEKDKELKVLQAEERRERAEQFSLHHTQR
jgi:hypothetical protein